MPLKSAHVSVTTSATLLAAGTDGAPGYPISVVVLNTGSTSVELGGADVTASTGYELGAGLSLSIDLVHGDDLYGIVSTTTCVVDVLKTRS